MITTNLTEYQIEIINRLQTLFKDLKIEIGRGDRLVVNDVIIKGFLVYDIRNRQTYDEDIEVFSNEILTK